MTNPPSAAPDGPAQDPTVIAQRLNLATGFQSSERDWVVHRLAALGSRLRSFPDTQVELEISIKERHGAGQRITLECWISRNPRLHLVSTSSAGDVSVAVGEVRDDLIRQIDDAKTRTEHRGGHARRPTP
ncbi:MAG TPA: HPF/RaiA family ribosome-associated protein [Actinophytocola sp.]|uniref:HPF/RaiA family ribosome-associated protein n=1 Tax=Actinophytocola sp. TaxID=1872138 RepID=UPI002DBD5925|nr:HPF/RaiA family ribosome-associated protein [Actinophytocola sp.]HEU5475892.1 HPF/RaiA family ribosome-associated protein [Actinophytocola sp.]